MKKRFLAIGLILLMIVSGCGQKSGFTKDDLCLEVGGAKYTLHGDIDAVIEDLGEDYDYSEAKSCDYDGLDKSFLYDVAEFYTYPKETADMINEIYTEDAGVATSKGIRVGASRADVLASYGDNCEDAGNRLVYKIESQPGSIDGGSLCFDLDNGAVSAIYITNIPT